MSVHMRVDMLVDMSVDMRVDMHVDMCVDMRVLPVSLIERPSRNRSAMIQHVVQACSAVLPLIRELPSAYISALTCRKPRFHKFTQS